LFTRKLAPQVPPASSSGTGTDATLSTQLRQLAELHASGALTDAEYTAAKARLLDGDE